MNLLPRRCRVPAGTLALLCLYSSSWTELCQKLVWVADLSIGCCRAHKALPLQRPFTACCLGLQGCSSVAARCLCMAADCSPAQPLQLADIKLSCAARQRCRPLVWEATQGINLRCTKVHHHCKSPITATSATMNASWLHNGCVS